MKCLNKLFYYNLQILIKLMLNMIKAKLAFKNKFLSLIYLADNKSLGKLFRLCLKSNLIEFFSYSIIFLSDFGYSSITITLN